MAPRSQVTVKTVITVTATVFAVAALAFAIVHASIAMTLTALAGLMAMALNHPVEWLVRRRWRRGGAIAAVMSLVVVALVGLSLLFIPAAVRQGRAFIEHTPQLVQKMKDTPAYQRLNKRLELDQKIKKLERQSAQAPEKGLSAAGKAAAGILGGVAALVTVVFLIGFMLAFGGPLISGFLREVLPSRRELYERVLAKIYRSVGGYLSGLALICTVNAFCTTTYLAIARVPFFLPLGILSGLSSLIPLAGNTLVGVFVSLVAFATGGLTKGLITAGWFVLYQQFENHVLGPLVYRRTVNVNPLVVLLGILFFAELWGIVGAVVAVPAIAAVQIILRELLAIRRERLNLPPTPPTPLLESKGAEQATRELEKHGARG